MLTGYAMTDEVLTAIASAVAIGLLWWLVARVRATLDRRTVYKWLRTNTRDEPDKSHVTTETLAKGTRLTEDRIRRACMSDPRINRLHGQPERWSVWRVELQSIYEKRGILRT
jgi:hypothetical protein